jgi:hypothetical protein
MGAELFEMLAVDDHALVVELKNLAGQLFIDCNPWGKRLTQPSVIAVAVDLENTAHADQAKLALVCLHNAYFTRTAWQSTLRSFLGYRAPLRFA